MNEHPKHRDLNGQYFLCQNGPKIMMVGPLVASNDNVWEASQLFAERHGCEPVSVSKC